jgi:5'-nucleotidase
VNSRFSRNTFAAALLIVAAEAVAAPQTVTLLHFSDYHSHALPFYSEGRPEQGGIARAIGYLERHKKRGALVFNGGDMMNKGAPAWSDKYGCLEWEWLNGVVDAMAFGNHDADYGADAFARCSERVRYPILSANTGGLTPYVVLERGGVKIGVFAIAGGDFPSLVKLPGLTFSDPTTAARATVKKLRDVERVQAVVMIGHESKDEDYALARAVPGIDVIFGTHSHLKQDLTPIPETATWFISPFQYLTYISRVELTFDKGKLTKVRGGLVPVDRSLPLSARVAKKVSQLQKDLEADPRYRELFTTIGTLPKPMSVESLGAFAVEVMRDAASADVALSTVSSFRQALPGGALDLETLRAAMPYDNELVVADLPAADYARLLELAEARRGTDSAFYVAGSAPAGKAVITVVTTDYVARIAPGYREVFAGVPLRSTGKRVRELVRQRLASRGVSFLRREIWSAAALAAALHSRPESGGYGRRSPDHTSLTHRLHRLSWPCRVRLRSPLLFIHSREVISR